MTILAFDCSSSVASIAIVKYDTDSKKERVLYHHNKPQERTNSSVFFQGLEKAMRLLFKLASADEVPGADGPEQLSIHKVLDGASTGTTPQLVAEVEVEKKSIQEHGKPHLIVVGIGPGSYNGLRSSIAAAQGIASVCNADLAPLPSALGFEEGAKGYWIAGNARGGHYWLARVKNHQFVEKPHLLLPEALEASLQKHPKLPLLSSTSLPQLSASIKIITKTPDALLLARLGKNKNLSWPLQPLYLKPVHVTVQQSLSSS